MRRLARIAALLVLVALAAVAMGARGDGGGQKSDQPYRVDVIFDDARGLVAGQLVKVAGAKVGKIEDVRLTPRFQARVEMTVDGRFAPFRADAACTIRPQGLIAENFVECDPGTQEAKVLSARGGGTPTIPVAQTTEPVNLTDLFNIFNTPTRQRFTVIINELGIATAGRGEDINAIIRRASPALLATRRALRIVSGQRAQLATMIEASDQLLSRLAPHRGRAQQFLVSAAAVTSEIANHRDALSQTVARLPAMLRESRGALRDLDTVAANGTPLLRALHAAAPDLNRVSGELPAFARAAKPASLAFGAALRRGTGASRRLVPVLENLRGYAVRSLPASKLVGRLYADLRQKGFVENMLSLFYYGAAASARFDKVSHIIPAHVLSAPDCLNFATTPAAGCDAHYGNGAAPVTRKAPSSSTTQSSRKALDFLLGR